MASRVIMPKLTDSMEEGVVVKWRKAEGERVESGDVLAEIETDKAVMDLEAFASGTLLKILVPEATTVPSGTLIGVIGEPDEDIRDILAGGQPSAARPSAPRPSPAAVALPEEDKLASPRVRTLARERGIDLKTVKGSGPGGRIVERDLEPFLPKKEQPTVREIPLTQMRKAIVRMTTQSKVPVLRDCGSKTLTQIAEAERALVARARSRDLSPEEYTGATFLISNLGKFDVESFSAVILPPAATALAVGSVREVPVVRDGRVEVGHRMMLTLSCDHRVIDGAVAAQFLQTFKQALERARDL